MPLSDLDGVHGRWETTNDNVLTVDPSVGMGKIKAPGKVIVKFFLKSGFTFTELEALAVSSVSKIMHTKLEEMIHFQL